MGSVNPQFEH